MMLNAFFISLNVHLDKEVFEFETTHQFHSLVGSLGSRSTPGPSGYHLLKKIPVPGSGAGII